MTASILGLKRSHARCNVALSMPMNIASIAVLNDVTLGCRDLFSTSICNSPKDLNLGFWEARMSRGEQLSLSWQPQRQRYDICRIFNVYDLSKVLLDNSTYCWLAYQQSMLIFTTIVLGHPKSVFESFQPLWESSRAFFRFFLVGILELSLDF